MKIEKETIDTIILNRNIKEQIDLLLRMQGHGVKIILIGYRLNEDSSMNIMLDGSVFHSLLVKVAMEIDKELEELCRL